MRLGKFCRRRVQLLLKRAVPGFISSQNSERCMQNSPVNSLLFGVPDCRGRSAVRIAVINCNKMRRVVNHIVVAFN